MSNYDIWCQTTKYERWRDKYYKTIEEWQAAHDKHWNEHKQNQKQEQIKQIRNHTTTNKDIELLTLPAEDIIKIHVEVKETQERASIEKAKSDATKVIEMQQKALEKQEAKRKQIQLNEENIIRKEAHNDDTFVWAAVPNYYKIWYDTTTNDEWRKRKYETIEAWENEHKIQWEKEKPDKADKETKWKNDWMNRRVINKLKNDKDIPTYPDWIEEWEQKEYDRPEQISHTWYGRAYYTREQTSFNEKRQKFNEQKQDHFDSVKKAYIDKHWEAVKKIFQYWEEQLENEEYKRNKDTEIKRLKEAQTGAQKKEQDK